MKHIIQKEKIKIICDECQKEISFHDQIDYAANLDFHFGYYSNRDQEQASFHLCNVCVEKLIKIVDERMNLDIDKRLKQSDKSPLE